MRTIAGQLHDAFEASGLSAPKLIACADLEFGRSSLLRKLAGELPLKTSEAEALAVALGIELVWNRGPRKGLSKLRRVA